MRVTNWLHIYLLIALCGASGVLQRAEAAMPRILDLQKAEYQKTPTFCWAASSVTVLNMLNPAGVNAGAKAQNRPVTQEVLAAFARARQQRKDIFATMTEGNSSYLAKIQKLNESHLPASPSLLNERLKGWLERCTDPYACSGTFVPILFNHEFDDTVAQRPLSWAEVRREIDERRPILFGWETEDKELHRAMGKHYSVVVGYDDRDGQCKVHIWDPWMDFGATRGAAPRTNAKPTKAIDYSMYCAPTSLMGAGATHEVDRFFIRPANAATGPLPRTGDGPRARPLTPTDDSCQCGPTLVPPLLRIADTRPPDLADFQRDFGDESSLRRTLEAAELPATGGARRLGRAFPVLALTSREILAARGDAKALLRPVVDAVLIPIEERGQVVDSLLVLPKGRGWKRAGYSNDAVTARLVAARRSFGPKIAGEEARVFVVSIPSRDAFFVGGGEGEAAVLVPVLANAPGGAHPDKPEYARDLLRRVSSEIEVELKRLGAAPGGSARQESETL